MINIGKSTDSKFRKLLTRCCEEPYRVFFPLALLMGIGGIGHWLWYVIGWQSNYSGMTHAGIQMQGYMLFFVLGFLLTAIPRMASVSSLLVTEFLLFILLIIMMNLAYLFQFWTLASIVHFLILVLFIRFLFSRMKNRKTGIGPPSEFIWIPIAVFHALLGIMMIILAQMELIPSWTFKISKPLIDQGFILCIVAGIGGFMAPRLMGTSTTKRNEGACSPDEMSQALKKSKAFHIIAAIGLFSSFWLELWNPSLAYLLRATSITCVFLKNRALPFPPKSPDFFAKLLWISMWMIALGLWLSAFWIKHRIGFMHMVFLGGFSLMTFSVGTMVILSHGGEAQKLKNRLWILYIIAFATLGAMILRIIAQFLPVYYFQLIGASSAIWLLGALSWLIYIIPKVFMIPRAFNFEEAHEEAKKNIIQ